MTTAERELGQNTNFDRNRIQESGQAVDPVFGPGYTGLVNIGNSCYMPAIMQVVFSTNSFMSRYYLNQSLKKVFDLSPVDPTVDLNMQLTKLAHGLLSGKYSVPPLEDALEFFLHVLDQVEKSHAGETELDPTRSFKFGVEERILCPSGKVTYNRSHDYILSLNIPLHEASDKACRKEYTETDFILDKALKFGNWE